MSPARIFARPTGTGIWAGPAQQAALGHLGERTAAVRVLVGPPSSGKTTLLAHACEQWVEGAEVLRSRGPQTQAAGLLSSLLTSAGLAPWELSTVEQRNLLTVLIQQRNAQGRRVVIALDDAQLVLGEAWSELERLAAWRSAGGASLEIVLVGSLGLLQRLHESEAAGSVAAVHRLPAPSSADVAGYLDWRLSRFDLHDLITPVAAQLIARSSGGRFNVVDSLSQMALLLMRRQHVERVDARVVRQAIAAFAARRDLPPEAATDRAAGRPMAAGEPPAGHLLITRDGTVLRRAELAPRLMIGRSEHNDVCLQSPYLSRHHAVIVGTPEGYYIVDLGSMNGVLLNGRPVARAVLSDRDILTLGPFRLKVRLPNWITQGNPLPEADSLADTAIMPQRPEAPPGIRRVK